MDTHILFFHHTWMHRDVSTSSFKNTILPTYLRTYVTNYSFTQGAFVRMVEELGIGRPSTYATIIEVLKTRR